MKCGIDDEMTLRTYIESDQEDIRIKYLKKTFQPSYKIGNCRILTASAEEEDAEEEFDWYSLTLALGCINPLPPFVPPTESSK